MPANIPCQLGQYLHKYTFRLMYGTCTNNTLAANRADIIYIYQEAKHCKYRIKTPANTIEGFFLVPEKLSWIIEPYVRQLHKKDIIKPADNVPAAQNPEKMFRYAHEVLEYLANTAEKPMLIICDINMPQVTGVEPRRKMLKTMADVVCAFLLHS